MRGRPLRIGHEPTAEPLVIGDRRIDKFARPELALGKQDRDLGDRMRQCIGHGDVPFSPVLVSTPRSAIRSTPYTRQSPDMWALGRNPRAGATLICSRLNLS